MNKGEESVGNRIRNLREINELSRETLAEMAGITARYLYDIETDQKHLSADILSRIAKSLSVSCDFIMYGYEEENKMQMEIVNIIEQMNTRQFWAVKRMIKTMADICDAFDV